MKSFVQFLFEAQSTVSVAWMKENYKKFNEELFNNELPDNIELGLIRDRKTDSLGVQGFRKIFYINKSKMVDDMYRMYYWVADYSNATRHESDSGSFAIITGFTNTEKYVDDISELEPYIEMSPKYQFTDVEKEDTLIHEMIHLWVSRNGLEPKRSHGKEFKRKCNEIREKAKKLYDKDYHLTTTASSDDGKNFSFTPEEQNRIKSDLMRSAQRGGGVYSIYIELDKSKMPNKTAADIKMMKFNKRFFFCTKRRLELILNQMKRSRAFGAATHIWISNTSYVPMCEKFGKFKTINNYCEFWDANYYNGAEEILKKDSKDILNENLNEGLLDGIKKLMKRIMSLFVKVPANTPMDNFNAEEVLGYAEEIDNDEEELKGTKENDKNAIKVEE